MRFTLESSTAINLVAACTASGIRIGERTLRSSFIVTPTRLIDNWPVGSLAELDATRLQVVLDLEPAIIVLGTGRRLRFPARALTAGVHSRGVGFEVMDTGAACRTYNVLALEGRKVAAALLLES